MAVLTAVLTHLPARLVDKQLAYLRDLAPDARFVVCHGGRRADFEALDDDTAIFIDDPSLRGPHFEMSLNATLRALYETHVRHDASVEHVYVIEYDHLVLRSDFRDQLTALAHATGAGLLAKRASARNDTNWPHYLAARDDAELNAFAQRVSRRDDPALRLGCLGTGMFFRRDAFQALCTVDDPPLAYFELVVPTVVHHLGFDVVDVDAVSGLYMDVRWVPEYDAAGARAAKRAGRTFVHPFKDIDALATIAGA